MIDSETLLKMSSTVFSVMPQRSQGIATVMDDLYAGANLPQIRAISYTVAVLHALSEPGVAQNVISLVLPFDAAVLWDIVTELSNSGVGEVFLAADGRRLVDALIVKDNTITYHQGSFLRNDGGSEDAE